MKKILLLPILVLFFTSACDAQKDRGKNMLGFSINAPLVPIAEIRHGGPPKDGIPSIDKPVFKPVGDYDFFDDEHRILGVYLNGIAKAYPIGILNWHEIVNDLFAEQAIVITYCPLCGSGVAFVAIIDGIATTFGVSGLLYNSDVLLYDRKTESLWSQIMAQAINGRKKGTELEIVSTANTTLGEWKKRHPNTLVLTTDTGFKRDYKRSPYGDYNESTLLYFPVAKESKTFHPKEMVIGLELDGKFKAYPLSRLAKSGKGDIRDKFNGRDLSITFNPNSFSATIKDETGNELPGIALFWFAWYAFHPDTKVYK